MYEPNRLTVDLVRCLVACVGVGLNDAAYYNEIDDYAAQWLRNLIAAGHIAPGEVDQRSIEDVHPEDLRGFTQCHFFAGIGVWSYALRLAGWPDDRPVWTGSCPCQPFSAAGKGVGFADERHLWPAFHWLIEQCQPPAVYGEQVASKAVDPWLDLVQADLEAVGYAFGAVAFPSAGVGAPHIRDRTYWVANADNSGRLGRGAGEAGHGRDTAWLEPERLCDAGGLCHADYARLEGHAGHGGAARWAGQERPVAQAGVFGGLADPDRQQRPHGQPGIGDEHAAAGRQQGAAAVAGLCDDLRSGPTNGHWRDADWLNCRDGKWRPVSPLPQPLVDGSSESLGRVRPEVITQVEEEVNAATAQSEGGRGAAMRDLLDHLGAQAKRSWAFGGVPGLHEAPFLLAFLRQLQAQGWRIAERLSVPCPETFAPGLRGLRSDGEPSGSPRQYGLAGQLSRERADAVLVLSSLLARHARTAWDDAHAAYAELGFPLVSGARSRVGRLRAYGNSIVPQVAAAFIRAAEGAMP